MALCIPVKWAAIAFPPGGPQSSPINSKHDNSVRRSLIWNLNDSVGVGEHRLWSSKSIWDSLSRCCCFFLDQFLLPLVACMLLTYIFTNNEFGFCEKKGEKEILFNSWVWLWVWWDTLTRVKRNHKGSQVVHASCQVSYIHNFLCHIFGWDLCSCRYNLPWKTNICCFCKGWLRMRSKVYNTWVMILIADSNSWWQLIIEFYAKLMPFIVLRNNI